MGKKILMIGCLLVMLVLYPAFSTIAGTGPSNPKIYGKTIGEWSGLWWNWAMNMPLDTNPMLNEGEVNCNLGQTGKVWFLAGNSGGLSERTCTVPAGKALFFPIINGVAWKGDAPDVPGLRLVALGYVEPVTQAICTVDGEPSVFNYSTIRTQSPPSYLYFTDECFLVELGYFEVGDYSPAISDGYWVMLPPLTPGEHTIWFKGVNEDPMWPWELEVTYHITVVE